MFNLKIPQSIFVHADGFNKASNSNASPPDPYLFSVLATNCAFAVELYLKCLIHIETNQLIKNEHNLRKLFSKLRDETQGEVEAAFNAILDQHPGYDLSKASEEMKAAAAKRSKNLREVLKTCENAFVEWRYLYEEDDDAVNAFGLFPLPPILRGAILRRKPEWGRFSFKMTKIGDALPKG